MNMKLLIVDDDLPFRERLTRSMEKKGFEVTSSAGFKDSLTKVNESNFDYAVVDMRLEDGSGLELVKELQKISPQTKSLLLTGYGNIATAVAAIKSGAVDYLPKPAEIDQIYAALTSIKDILPPPPENPMTADRIRWEHIQRVFIQCNRNVSETARRLRMHRRGRFKLFKHARMRLTRKIEAHAEAVLTFNGEVEAPEMVGNLMTEDGGSITINVVEGDVTLKKSRGWFSHIKGKLYMKELGRIRSARIDGDVDVDGSDAVFAADLVNGDVMVKRGRVEPGDSPGITEVVGDYTQQANGLLEVEIQGTNASTPDYDQLKVSGALNLAGTLEVVLLNGFVPSAGDEYTIMTFGSLTGTFGTITLPDISSEILQLRLCMMIIFILEM